LTLRDLARLSSATTSAASAAAAKAPAPSPTGETIIDGKQPEVSG
jgi:hypothetical protein